MIRLIYIIIYTYILVWLPDIAYFSKSLRYCFSELYISFFISQIYNNTFHLIRIYSTHSLVVCDLSISIHFSVIFEFLLSWAKNKNRNTCPFARENCDKSHSIIHFKNLLEESTWWANGTCEIPNKWWK